MEEIKFRYTVTRENGFVFSKIFILSQIEKGEVNIWTKANYINEKDIHRDLFTGFQDKNNIDIYANDVWKRDEFLGIVVFECAQWIFKKLPKSCYSYPSFYSNVQSGEKIGNSYENPELLSY